jgi:hypothetical protein
MPGARQVTIAAILLTAGAAAYALWPIWGVAPARNQPARRELAPLPEQVFESAPGQATGEVLLARGTARFDTGGAELPAPHDAGRELRDERVLMAKLRALGATAPERALQLAREGNALFPNSPDAAERAWFVVKSLDSLGRFREGRDEARTMVERYRGSSWAADVERHTLVYPLDQPSREEMQARERERDL